MIGFGPTPATSVLSDNLWFDQTENVAHLLFGVVALAAYFFLKDDVYTKWLVWLIFLVAAATTVTGFLNAGAAVPNIDIFGLAKTNLENPSDNVLHLVVAAWAGLVGFKSMR
jgi:hypothetical protein